MNSLPISGAALALAETGREDEARALVLAEDLGKVPSDQNWPPAMFLWAEGCSRLRIPDHVWTMTEIAGLLD
jgi:hypothetical protein